MAPISTDDDKERAPLLCAACERPIWINENGGEDEDLHVCGCKAEDRPDGWRFMTKREMIDDASRWL